MKSLRVIFTLTFVGMAGLSSTIQAQDYGPGDQLPKNRYVRDNQERNQEGVISGYRETSQPLIAAQSLSSGDPHVKIIGWDPIVSLQQFMSGIQEGVTDQLAILRLYSAPNAIIRSHDEKEVWFYYYLWSYDYEQDPNRTLIYMDHPGKRVVRNKKPVSMRIVFNDNNVVESYQIRLLKVLKDEFNAL